MRSMAVSAIELLAEPSSKRRARRSHDLDRDIRTIADDRVHSPTEQASNVVRFVYRPHLDVMIRAVRVLDEATRHDAVRPRQLRHLVFLIRRTPHRPAHPGS